MTTEPLCGEASELVLEALVLAAGAGSRFGGRKLTLPWRGAPLLHGVLGAAFAAQVRSVIVVTGDDANVALVARAWAEASGHARRLRLVHAADHAAGLSASLKAGLAAVALDTDGAFIFLGDMPLIPPGVPTALASALAQGGLAAAPVFEGRRGHPVLARRALFEALSGAAGDEGARSALASLGDDLILVGTDDPGVLFDVDTPEES
jgi:molybdenum cofactor cytidylyltransferase